MGEVTGIAWTDHTFNAWIGCHKVSEACKHCYAEIETFPRVQRSKGLELWGAHAERHVTSDENWRMPLTWNRNAEAAGECRRVFCSSLSDVFEKMAGATGAKLNAARARLFALIEATPWLDWLLLTKRPENVLEMVPEHWRKRFPRNVWMGTTVENQARVIERVPELLRCPAAVHFVSVEPLLEKVSFTSIPANLDTLRGATDDGVGWDWFNALTGFGEGPNPEYSTSQVYPKLDWVIVGGESGSHARPFDVDWAFDLRKQCEESGTAFFFKQAGAHVTWNGCSSPGEHWPSGTKKEDTGQGNWRMRPNHPKGGDLAELPERLRVRQLPEVRHAE
jgi:protein gp37